MTDPLLLRIQTIENNAKLRNSYDYDRVMKDIEISLRLKKRRGMSEKNLEEKRKLEQEKLKLMEEKREEILSAKINKIKNKMKEREKILSYREKNLIKSTSLKPVDTVQMRIEQIRQDEIDDCLDLNDYLLDKYKLHENNRENTLNDRRLKYLKTDVEYENRAKRYKRKVEINDKKKLDEYNRQQIENCYNIKECFDRHKSPKIKLMKERNKRHFEELKERQYELMINDEKRKRDILNKLNHVPNGIIDDERIKYDYIHRQNLANLQKENLERLENERKERYDGILERQKDAFRWATDENKEDIRIKKLSQQQTLLTQIELDKKFEELNQFMRELEGKSILKKDNDQRLKIFYEKNKDLKHYYQE